MWTHQGNNGIERKVVFENKLGASLNDAVMQGYCESFKVTMRGLYAISKGRYYRPEQVRIVSSVGFDINQNSQQNGCLYLITTTDGVKGTLLHRMDSNPDELIGHFLKAVEEIRKKIERHNLH